MKEFTSHTELYYHGVWTTWDRLPIITTQIEPVIYETIKSRCLERKCQLISIGGIEDHVHVLIRLSPTDAISTIIKELKGSSSFVVNKTFPEANFKWRESYAAFTVCTRNVPIIQAYINKQKQHHQRNTINNKYEIE